MKIQIEKSETAGNKPTNYFWVVDLSGSMSYSVNNLKQTLLSTKTIIGPQDTISIGWFSSRGQYDWLVKGAKLDDKNFERLINEKFYARGLTCYNEILGSLTETVDNVQLSTGNTNNTLFFLSDGYCNDGSTDESVIRVCSNIASKNMFSEIRVIGYDQYYNRELLIRMSQTLKGQFSHISDHMQFNKDYNQLMKSKVQVETIELGAVYDYVWQVTDTDINIYPSDSKVQVLVTDKPSELFAINQNEIDDINLSDPKAVYSLAVVLSKANKANLAVNLLRKAGDIQTAKMLQKAFTVSQKGRAENELTYLALSQSEVHQSSIPSSQLLKDWIKDLEDLVEKGQVSINTEYSEYESITKKKKDVQAVNFKSVDKNAKIVEIKGNENRPNVTLLTVRNGNITDIVDPDLKARVEAFNAGQSPDKQIILPFACESFKNYTFVSNGQFNFKSLFLNLPQGTAIIDPAQDVDLFDPEVKTIKVQDFVNLNKNLILTKAQVSVLNWYIKNNSQVKHRDDVRQKWGPEGAALLEEMGLDYKLRFSPKKEKEQPRAEDADYIPVLEIDTYIKGCSTISVPKSYEKKQKGGKPNEIDNYLWSLFDKYDKQLKELGQDLFIKTRQTEVEGLSKVVKVLSQELAGQKFYLIMTNSWLEGIDKAESVEYNGLVINTKTVKEYI